MSEVTKFTVLASSSSANCIAVQHGPGVILLDCGLSFRAANSYLRMNKIPTAGIAAILLTHEHADHSKGIAGFYANTDALLVTSKHTAKAIGVDVFTEPGCKIGEFHIDAFPVPHDAADPLGFMIEVNGLRFGYLTDIGVVTKLMVERLKGCKILFVEANHDPRMAESSDRHGSVKHRVASWHGHISNESAGMLVAELYKHGLRKAVLCHLSQECNDPVIAQNTVQIAAPLVEVLVATHGLRVEA